ncbi:medium-chain fatty acid-CoA ligase faa2, partial [Coemansia sp. RSA 485]
MDNVARNPDNYFLGTRRCSKEADGFEHYEWISTTDASSIVNQLGAGLQSIFEMYAPEVNPITKQQPLGIFSTNRPEWILAEQAGFRYRKYIVGISDEIDFEQCMLQINEADIRVLVCSIDKIPPIFSRIEKMPNLKVIISMDNFDLCKHTSASMSFNLNDVNGLHAKAKSAGITLFDFKAVLEVGKSSSVPPMPPKPSDYSMLIFKTKTGNCPLGVLHTHESIVHCSRSIYLSMETSIDAVVHLSHLPLAKEFEHSIVYMFMFGTVHIGFGSGSDERLIDDMQFLHPTVLVALPNQLE